MYVVHILVRIVQEVLSIIIIISAAWNWTRFSGHTVVLHVFIDFCAKVVLTSMLNSLSMVMLIIQTYAWRKSYILADWFFTNEACIGYIHLQLSKRPSTGIKNELIIMSEFTSSLFFLKWPEIISWNREGQTDSTPVGK